MDTLTPESMEQALVPTSTQQIAAEMDELVELLAGVTLGTEYAGIDDLPVWYVIGKAAGASGISVQQLLNDPIARRFAIGIYIAELNASQKVQDAWKKQQMQKG